MSSPNPGPFVTRSTCCPAACAGGKRALSRRGFLGGLGAAAVGGAAVGGLRWPLLSAADSEAAAPPERAALVVKPVFVYSVYAPQQQTSWRAWGGIQTQKDADEEIPRIKAELDKLQKAADFPLQLLPVSAVQSSSQVKALDDVKQADAILVYAAGGDLDAFEGLGKNCIFFVRYRSGPVYLWYEIISPRFIRHHTDVLKTKGIDNQDVVVDSQDEILWRLRSLCGLKNTMGTRIVALGGAGGWAAPNAPELSQDRWKLDIRSVSYQDIEKLIKAARDDARAVERAKARAAAYLAQDGLKLETKKEFVDNAFLLEQIFRDLMTAAGARAFTINNCMSAIMPLAETTACMTLSILNDSGYQAYCESDFVVVPAGILLTGISGRPSFLNDPTYPAGGIITLAHCTAPRKMDGKNLEPARILTHFESDYGAAPKVEMHNGQKVTNIIPDFLEQRWVGLSGEIVDHPFFPICRSQIDIQFKCDSLLLADRMPGFHWMTIYGDYMKEVGYAMKKTKVTWENLG